MKLPDGRVQIVSYIADENGYKADVKYEGDENPVLSEAPLKNQVEKPVFTRPNLRSNYNNLQSDFPRRQYLRKLQPDGYYDPILSTNVAGSYIAATPAPFYVVTPKPTYFASTINNYNELPRHREIQIFNNGLFGKSTLGSSTEYYPSVLSENADSGAYQNIYIPSLKL